jgi:thiol-disulfide isomerase/thioredoxin
MVFFKKGIILLLFAGSFTAHAQTVEVVRFAELQKIIRTASHEVLVVNFWATWCKPCVKEIGIFDQVAKAYTSRNVRVVLVSLDFAKELDTKVKPFVKKKNIHSQVVLLQEKDPNAWIDQVDKSWSGAIPATLILNQAANKRIFLEKELTYTQLESYLKSIL